MQVLEQGGHGRKSTSECHTSLADEEIRKLWDAFEISDPFVPNCCTIESPIGKFRYEALTLASAGELSGIVVQVPDRSSQELLAQGFASK